MQEYELSLSFSSPKVPSLDIRRFAKVETYLSGNEATVNIVQESQVIDAFDAFRDAGIRPRKFYLSSKQNHADQLDPDLLIGAIPGPEYSADVANADLVCRGFIPDDVSLRLCSRPAKSRPYVSAHNRHVMSAELADYFADVADSTSGDISIDGKVSSEWKSVNFTQKYDILHWLPKPKNYQCRICKTECGATPYTILGRHGDWTAPLYCDSQPHGHGFNEYSLFVPIAHLADFDRWTKRQVRFQPVFSDSVGPGSIAHRVLTGTLK